MLVVLFFRLYVVAFTATGRLVLIQFWPCMTPFAAVAPVCLAIVFACLAFVVFCFFALSVVLCSEDFCLFVFLLVCLFLCFVSAHTFLCGCNFLFRSLFVTHASFGTTALKIASASRCRAQCVAPRLMLSRSLSHEAAIGIEYV